MSQVTIDREVLERAVVAIAAVSAYGRVGTKDVEQAALQDCANDLRAALQSAPAQPEQKQCKCNFRQRMVGDGCDVCNPELAAELAAQPAPNAEVERLREALEELCDIVEGALEDKSSVWSLIDSFTTQPARTALAQRGNV